MEALSLLKYWRTNTGDVTNHTNVTNTTTIVTGISSHPSESSDEEEEDDENDHGPFFDLAFTLPEQEETTAAAQQHLTNEEEYYHIDEDCNRSESSDDSDIERELKFTLMTSSSDDSTTDLNLYDSPKNNLFFNGGFVPVDNTMEMNSKMPQFRLALVKSATKFRVMMLKFRKLKMNTESKENTELNESSGSNSKQVQQKQSQTETEENTDSGTSMKFKVEEVPIVKLFKRHNSSKPTKKQQVNNEITSSTEEKKFTKDTMHKYLRKVKPLYVRVSQKYIEKLKLNGNLTFPKVTNPQKEKQTCEVEVAADPPLVQNTGKGLKQGNLPAGLRVVCKHFGKTWSATTTVAATSATASVIAPGAIQSNRRDDSLLQQQDGIQSAILHCKRSFKASRELGSSSSEA